MEISPDGLARKIVEKYKQLPENERLLVAVAGPPGSGKSTLAYPLTDALNSLLLHHPPPNPAHIEQPRSLELAEANEQQGKNDEVAICVGLDGWHYSREELDGFEDPKEAHWRRGAAFTFNLPSYTTFLQSIRQPLSSSKEISFPTFDHALKDPAISPVKITSQHRIIIIEGLYCLLDQPGWAESSEMFDIRIWVEVDKQEARERVLKRNFEAGIVEDYKACEQRVDAVDMANGEEVRTYRVQPDYIITSIQDHPFSREAFSGI
ncbi:hypothetical protein I302_105873 [Kwoniella bestiolae CBS 10118]|uniref:Phosphoribulokinase/uridine kinase domain-containing protein n=1 Tax=Kwoniella bestiolae CBS 10118 TaxID=1296100 RepID=A0A1B9G2E9_9TREE|nr:hypothetical protein I302_04997 [Kwoniella bestiolae CBS 10118]OCF25185.1 hypothetical protein I302_04997 [Kwoniella bestiolae CBS 10118]